MTRFNWFSIPSIFALVFVLACGGSDVAAPTAPAAATMSETPAAQATEAPKIQATEELKTAPTIEPMLAPTAAPETAGRPPVVPPLAARDGAQYGGTMTIGYFRKAANMDGIRSSGSFDRIYLHLSNEYMVTLGRQAEYEPQESLALTPSRSLMKDSGSASTFATASSSIGAPGS